MEKKEFKTYYDYGNDFLRINHVNDIDNNPKVKNFDSLKIPAGYILYDKHIAIHCLANYEVMRLEFYEASKKLSSLTKSKITKNILKTVKRGYLKTEIKNGEWVLRYDLFFEKIKKALSGKIVLTNKKFATMPISLRILYIILIIFSPIIIIILILYDIFHRKKAGFHG